ncbi:MULTISPECIES: AMIN-like domain-containing (lipo)protein [unclassified Micromonospora]|uniref:AMIN-like domain-containing (lipo)protein n=1 Tax=unclassified Micromonospora TaxID=2617518 RepID=UPI002FF045B2
MRIRSGLMALVVVLGGLVAGAGTGTAATTRAAATGSPYCGITWGSGEKSAGTLSSAPLINVRTGRHDCFDRVVFEFAGPVNGYTVTYGETWTEGEGLALSPYTAGGALLRVSLQAPAYDDGHVATVPYRVGEHAANVLRYPTLRDVVFGGSFEGYTTFAVGVRARLPFRTFVLAGPGTHSRIVLDVAHQWQE